MNENIMGMLALQPLLNGKPYLPFTNTSLKQCAMAHLLNDIVINERKNILELGSGLSTIMMARLIDSNKLRTSITSVDHNADWILKVKEMLRHEGLGDKVKFIHAPLETKKRYALRDYLWYDENILSAEFMKPFADTQIRIRFDLVLVDGPPAYNEDIMYSRAFAFPFLRDHLKQSFTVMLDDVNRLGEKHALKQWEEILGPSKIYHNQLGVITNGSSYDVASL